MIVMGGNNVKMTAAGWEKTTPGDPQEPEVGFPPRGTKQGDGFYRGPLARNNQNREGQDREQC